MKYSLLLLLSAICLSCAQKADYFVLRGTVPGAMDSTQVELRSEDRNIRLSGYIVDGKFELRGEAPVASFCNLAMNNYEAAKRLGKMDDNTVKYVEAGIFVENGNLVFIVPHIDSLPHSFWLYDIRKENNYTLKGSAAHNVFDNFRRKTMDLQYRIRRESRAEADEKREPDMKALAAMKEELRRETRDFIASNRNLPVNLYLAKSLKMEPFTYTQADLDAMTALFADYTDTLPALQAFRAEYERASAYAQGVPFAGGRVYTPKGDTLDLKQYMKPGRYMLIDFWASWCGPCRASFPHLRKVHAEHGKQLVFLSVSVDKNDADWRKAMKEEQLPWTQLCATPAFSRGMGRLYSINSIPTFLIVDPDGNIIFSGHDSGELDLKLEELL